MYMYSVEPLDRGCSYKGVFFPLHVHCNLNSNLRLTDNKHKKKLDRKNIIE